MIELNFIPFPELETERFILRRLMTTDENEIFALRSDDRINEFLDRQKAQSMEDARQFISRIDDGLKNNQAVLWVISSRDDPRFVGTICLWNISKENATAELGYELLPAFHGFGIMQEVIPRIIRFGFETINLDSIQAELSIRNLKSIRLLEKNNFIRTAVNEENPDVVIYSLENKG